MLKKAKKILALVLALITICGALPMAASAADKESDTVIYILGYGGDLFADRSNINSEKIYPLKVDVAAVIKEAAAPCLAALGTASLTGDYSDYCEEIYKRMAPVYEPVLLNPDGTPKTDEATGKVNGKLSPTGLTGHDYFEAKECYYFYDWRLSPLTLVNDLSAVINKLSASSETGKVDLVGRCYGANLISTYLALNGDVTDKVDDIIMYVPSTEGIGLIGRLFSGQIELNADAINEYVNELIKYEGIIEDSFVKNFIDVFLLIFEQAEMLNLGTKKVQELIDAIKTDLIAPLIRNSYGSFPSFWAMVPDEYFADAVAFVYNTDEIRKEYAGTLKLITEYHNAVQLTSRKTLKAHAEKGLDIHVVSKYNLPSAPLFGNTNPMSDAVAETALTSFGATASEYGKALSASYIEAMSEENKKYLSPDEKIDASTCLFPEKTWFIKNCYHDYFDADALYTFLDAILLTDGMTIDTFEEYPQFIDANISADTLTPVTGKDAELPEKGSDDSKIRMLFKFIMVIIEAITKLFKGELSFKEFGEIFAK